MSTRVPPTWRFNLELIRTEPRIWAVHSVLHALFLASRVLPGLLEKGIFDTLSQSTAAWGSLWSLVALYGSIEIARAISELGASWYGWSFRFLTANRLRSGLLRQSLAAPAASPLPVTAGDAINRYRDDVGEVTDFPLWLPDALGNIISFVIAVGIMAIINLGVTLAVFLPLSATVFVTKVFWRRMLAYRRTVRRYTASVAAFLGEILGAVQAIKVAGREEGVLRHFAGLNEKRRQAAIKDEVLNSLLFSLGESTAVLGVGITLLAASGAISRGTFTVGDFALFVYYLWFAAELPSYLGSFAGDYGEQAVAIERLAELAAPAPVERMVHTGRMPAEAAASEHAGGPLATLEVRGLTYRHPDGGRGIARAGFSVERGTLTAITGRIGSGKSTLLQAMLGLLPAQEGEVLWNGQVIRDPATFFVPPRCTYVPQAPRLFSDTLRENIALGWPVSDEELRRAVWQSALEEDVAALPAGLETLVGPRGLRLSGGQLARTAAARALVRAPELLVLDDLSSALDVHTAATMWDRILLPGLTCIVATNQPELLRRATQVVPAASFSIQNQMQDNTGGF